MNNARVLIVAIFILGFQCHAPEQQSGKPTTIKIACVGNSITYGAGVFNREKNAYPTQLQHLLGSDYEVRNFGVSGATLLKNGDYPYWNTDAYQQALDFTPDVVFIKLGTNDSKQQNRQHLYEFQEDYKSLIASFQKQNANARIILLLPIPSFSPDSTAIWDPVIKDNIIPEIQSVAYQTGAEVIDLYQLFVSSPGLLPDKIHPSSLGATVMAKRAYQAILQASNHGFDIINQLGIDEYQQSDFHGYEQFDFQFDAIASKIVRPKVIHPERPWVWRARFWGHEPQTDIALLERGFHIVYHDVSNLFGGPEAIKRWDRYYEWLTQAGMATKAVLEGMSRGGLVIYNWAAANPDKVACVYADAPVLDGKSWPGGLGAGQGSEPDWEKFKAVYQLNSKSSVDAFDDNPIHKAEIIAGAGFPMLHVCGEVDNVVPLNENTRIFEQAVLKAGGRIEVISKNEVGHHPHSLKDPSPIVDFILRATGYKINFAAVPMPGAEYRSAAGWKEGKDWWAQANEIDSLCKSAGKIDLLLIGNSITQGWGGPRTLVTYKPGQSAAEKHFAGLKWIGAGISGDQTQHIAWRLANGSFEKCKPDFITLAIGVNNFSSNTAEEIVDGIAEDLQLLEQKFPLSAILLFGPLPAGLTRHSELRTKYDQVHRLISAMVYSKTIHHHNLLEQFINADSALNLDLYSNDGIHLKPEGYEVWARFITEQIDHLK